MYLKFTSKIPKTEIFSQYCVILTLTKQLTLLIIKDLMNEHQKISLELEKLMSSKFFAKPGIYRDLLKYLVACSVKGEVPKEQQIAMDVFGWKANQDKEPNVRVYILNLRKKLDDYYRNEGKEDDVILKIPKGKYQVEFKVLKYKSLRKSINRSGVIFFFSGLGMLIICLILILNPDLFRQPKQRIWKEFLKADYPVLIVLGDHYFFSDTLSTGNRGSSRDTRINSDEDMNRFLEENPALIHRIKKSTTNYINKQAPLGLFSLMKMFGGSIADVQVEFSSRLSWEDTRNKHLIFIGSVKTLRFLEQTLEHVGVKYNLEQTTFSYSTASDTLIFDNRTGNYLSHDYSTLIFLTTEDERKVLFLLSDADIGNMAAMKYLTDSRNTDFPKDKNLKNFKAVFEVQGRELTDFKIKLIRTDPILKSSSEIWP